MKTREILEKLEDRSEYLGWEYDYAEEEVIYISFSDPTKLEQYQLGRLPKFGSIIEDSSATRVFFRLYDEEDMEVLEQLLDKTEREVEIACMERGTEPEDPKDARREFYEEMARNDRVLDELDERRESREAANRYASPPLETE